MLDQGITATDPSIIVFDERLRVHHVGPGGMAILGLPAELGARRWPLAQVLEAASGLDPAGRAALHSHCRAIVRGAQPGSRSINSVSGQSLELVVRPLAGRRWAAELRHSSDGAPVQGLDPITQLADFWLLRNRLAAALARPSARAGVALVVVELDGFRSVRDVLGASVGDALLVAVAGRLRTLQREVRLLARTSTDQFAVVLTGRAEAADATGLARRIVDLIDRPYIVRGELATIGACAGVALGERDLRDPDEMIRRAQLALSYSRSNAVGGPRLFEPGLDTHAQAQRALERDLRKALPLQEFELFYQPQLDLLTERLVGFEALIRWRHKLRGLVSPGEFIPIAERNGLIVPIGEWALRVACMEAASWSEPLRVAVNVSPLQFSGECDLVRVTRDALQRSGLDPTRLEIEITESALLGGASGTQSVLHELKALGVRVSMDDFGTGYSSLGQLRSFPFDKLKIDRSFIQELVVSPDAAAMVRAIATLASSLGMSIIAEGVETHEQARAVAQEGCTDIQGYLVSPPVPRDEIGAMIERYRG